MTSQLFYLDPAIGIARTMNNWYRLLKHEQDSGGRMQFADRKLRFAKISRDPGLFIAACGLLCAAKSAGPLHFGFRGFLVFVVPPGYNTDHYEAAAASILDVKRGDWAGDWVNRTPEYVSRIRLRSKAVSPCKKVLVFPLH